VNTVGPDSEGLSAAAQIIHSGGVVAYPTETVYGLGADPFSTHAVDALKRCKVRPDNNPVLLVVADLDQLNEVVSEFSSRARAFAEAFWPGPLSLVLPKSGRIPEAVTAGSPKVSVRCPGCETARHLCTVVGHAITSTSANLSGEPPATSLDGLELPGLSLGIDGGVLTAQSVSTVYDPDTDYIFREGAITRAQLDAI
jgi:L-threonylcarbamoyladenylate synthase